MPTQAVKSKTEAIKIANKLEALGYTVDKTSAGVCGNRQVNNIGGTTNIVLRVQIPNETPTGMKAAIRQEILEGRIAKYATYKADAKVGEIKGFSPEEKQLLSITKASPEFKALSADDKKKRSVAERRLGNYVDAVFSERHGKDIEQSVDGKFKVLQSELEGLGFTIGKPTTHKVKQKGETAEMTATIPADLQRKGWRALVIDASDKTKLCDAVTNLADHVNSDPARATAHDKRTSHISHASCAITGKQHVSDDRFKQLEGAHGRELEAQLKQQIKAAERAVKTADRGVKGAQQRLQKAESHLAGLKARAGSETSVGITM